MNTNATPAVRAAALMKLADVCNFCPSAVAAELRNAARSLPDIEPGQEEAEAEALFARLCKCGGGGIIAAGARRLMLPNGGAK